MSSVLKFGIGEIFKCIKCEKSFIGNFLLNKYFKEVYSDEKFYKCI